MTEGVYRRPVENIDDLENRIRQEFRELRVDDCRRAIESMVNGLWAMVDNGGNHFDLRLND